MTRFVKIAGRFVRPESIEQVMLSDCDHASIWIIGRSEPLQCRSDEVPAIREYVTEARA